MSVEERSDIFHHVSFRCLFSKSHNINLSSAACWKNVVDGRQRTTELLYIWNIVKMKRKKAPQKNRLKKSFHLKQFKTDASIEQQKPEFAIDKKTNEHPTPINSAWRCFLFGSFSAHSKSRLMIVCFNSSFAGVFFYCHHRKSHFYLFISGNSKAEMKRSLFSSKYERRYAEWKRFFSIFYW